MKFIKSLLFIAALANSSCSKAQQQNLLITKTETTLSTNPIIIGSKIKLFSEALGSYRELFISLPEKYNQETQNYPVVFVMDADHMAMFDLTRSITGLLAKTDLMPESIIVGLTNNGNLNNRFSMTSGLERGSGFYENKASDYVHFLQDVVIPYMEKNYRVVNHKTIIGLSPSNGPLYEAFYNQPNLFNAYVFLAADLHFRYHKEQSRGDKLIASMNDKSHPKATVYLGMGSEDVEFNQDFGRQFEKHKKDVEKENNSKVNHKFEILDGEGHYEMAAKGIKNAFNHIYPKEIWNRQNSYHLDRGERPIDLKKHFDKLSTYYGFEIFPPASKLEHQTRALLRWGNPNNIKTAISLLTQGVIYYPNSASLHLILAKAYKKSNNIDSAKLYYEKAQVLALEFPPKNYNWFAEKVKEFEN